MKMATPNLLRSYIYKQLNFFADIENAVLFDYPNYVNFGDLLIWLGQLSFLRNWRVKIFGQYHIGQCALDLLEEIIGNKTILLQGGGNFGDLHPWHQNLRTRIIEKFKTNKIIMFPQTMHYSNTDLLKKDAEKYNRHPNLYLMWRDIKSYEIAQAYFKHNRSFLIPDMAFCLNLSSCACPKEDRNAILFLRRTDTEKKEYEHLNRINGLYIRDWKDLAGQLDSSASTMINIVRHGYRYLCKSVGRIVGPQLFMTVCKKETDNYHLFAIQCQGIAASEFSRYKIIVSDRLHGHILATLLRIPNILLDNSYGKNREFYNTWTYTDEISRFANSTEELFACMEDLEKRVIS